MKWYKYWTLMPLCFFLVSLVYMVTIFEIGDCYCFIGGQEYETFFAYAFYFPYFAFIYFLGFIYAAIYWMCLALSKKVKAMKKS